MEDKSEILNFKESPEESVKGDIKDLYLKRKLKPEKEGSVLAKEKSVLAGVINFMYGQDNAKRLISIIDKVIKEVETYKKLIDCEQSKDLEKDFLNLITDKEKQKHKFDNSRYAKIRTMFVQKEIVYMYVRCMILLGILTIKKSDLNFNFDIEESELNGYCRDLIYNYIASDKFKNKILSFMASENHIYDSSEEANKNDYKGVYGILSADLRRFYEFLCPEVKNQNNEVYEAYQRKMFVCFVKVVFWSPIIVPNRFNNKSKEDKSELVDSYLEFAYNLKYVFYESKEKNVGKQRHWKVKTMAQYLWLTGEIASYFSQLKYIFTSYFASRMPSVESVKKKVKGIAFKMELHLEDFLLYLNKTESSISKKYNEACEDKKYKEFWEMLFPHKIYHCPVIYSNLIKQVLRITPYLIEDTRDPRKDTKTLSVIYDMNDVLHIDKAALFDCLDNGYNLNTGNNLRNAAEFMFNPARREEIIPSELLSYFDNLVVYFLGMEGKNLSSDDRELLDFFAQQIMPWWIYYHLVFINNKKEKDPKCSSKKEDQNQNQINFVNEINEKSDDKNNKNSKISNKLIETNESETKDLNFGSKEKRQNQNKINFTNEINEKSDDKNNKSSEISNNNSIKTTMNNVSKRSIFGKINTSLNLNDKIPGLQQTNSQQK